MRRWGEAGEKFGIAQRKLQPPGDVGRRNTLGKKRCRRLLLSCVETAQRGGLGLNLKAGKQGLLLFVR